jgi:DNA-cytosine methyltransferase
MNVLSLFDGMSCGQIALDKLGIKVDNYFASEIDKYAIKVTQANYPNTKQLGDVTKWQDWDIDWSNIDLVLGGFPCQAWSVAGKQLGDKDEGGMLFWTMLDIMKKVLNANPKAKFLIENVRMKKEFEEYITKHTENALGKVNKHLINSALVSAQNRNRYYWTNINGIEQPEDKGLLLKAVLEDNGVADIVINRDYKGFGNQGMTGVRVSCIQVGEADIKGRDSLKRVYSPDGKAPTITTCQGGHQEPKVSLTQHGDKLRHPEATKKGYAEAGVGEGLDLTFPKSKTRRGRSMIQKSNCLTVANFDYGVIEKPKFTDTGLIWRKLTPKECERLQTVPDEYTLVLLPPTKSGKVKMMSNSQRYKMLGNGWTVDVIAHILKNIKL